MKSTRRGFIAKGVLGATLLAGGISSCNSESKTVNENREATYKILDDAAKRIVKLAAPYSPFPDKLKQEADVIHITRSWEFMNNSEFKTQ